MSATATQPRATYHQRDERSLGDLFAELTRELRTLLRQEVMLARAEVTDQASALGGDVTKMAIGGFVAYAGFLAIVAAAIAALAEAIPLWASALVVGVVVALAGYLVLRAAQNSLKKRSLTPRETVQTIKEDAQWLKDQVR
ncbi:MAG: phage holin family protein [Anaerolineae bacterium]